MRFSGFCFIAGLICAVVGGDAAGTSDTVAAGFHVVWSYPGTTIPSALLDATKAGKVGGVILFGENVNDQLPSQIASLQSAYKQSPSYPGYPLLITTDQEGGQVNRLPGGPTQSAKQVGQSSDPATAGKNAGSTVASVFKQYNTNGDLAPVLDVYRQAGNFIDEYQRSYGNTSALVSKCIGPFISALQSSSYAATAKHFPGLGAAPRGQNTDVQPVTLNLSLDEIRSIDEQPYTTAFQNGLKMVMPSWAIYPALDSTYPSGLSKKWLQDELRTRLGFTGVTISDAIEAGALSSFGDTKTRSVMAMNAGMDIILASARNVSQGFDAYNGILSAYQSGQLNRQAFQASTQRVMAMRKTLQ